jgi:molybdopterin/thiamine biosynthesis adenylyltransferase
MLMDDDQLLRYSRHILLPQIDIVGQERLLSSSALIIGLGGLGSPAAMYLAAAGIGSLVLNDFDRVDLSNLQRQTLHGTCNIGELKTHSARNFLNRLNPEVNVSCVEGVLTDRSLEEAVAGVNVVLDCSDNLATRYRVNAACHAQSRMLISGAVIRFEGQLAVFAPGKADSPCYNCLYASDTDQVETCSQSGVIAPLPGIIGSMQALQAIKLITGIGDSLLGSLLLFDGLSMEWHRIRLPKNPECPTCGFTPADGGS